VRGTEDAGHAHRRTRCQVEAARWRAPRAQRSFRSPAAASRTMPEDKDARPECDQPGAHLVLPEELKLRCTLEARATAGGRWQTQGGR
jgi:hypothetical protein